MNDSEARTHVLRFMLLSIVLGGIGAPMLILGWALLFFSTGIYDGRMFGIGMTLTLIGGALIIGLVLADRANRMARARRDAEETVGLDELFEDVPPREQP